MCEVRFLPPGETIWDAILRAKRLWFLALIFSGWANLLGWIPSCPHTWGTSSSLTPSKIGLKKDLSLRWYSVATFMFARATGLSFLPVISAALLYVALIAWGITFIGMARELASMFVPRGKRDNAVVLRNPQHDREIQIGRASCRERV